MIKKNTSSMKVRRKLMPPKKREAVQKDYRKKIKAGPNPYSSAKTGKVQLRLGTPRGISGKKSDHGGMTGKGVFRKGKGVPAAIRKVPKDTYKRKKA